MRPISVLNVEGRLFFSIFHYRLAPFLVKNGYIKIKEQKVFIYGIAGGIEQGTLVYEALRYVVRHQTAITVAWLSLANAYGSVNHMLIQFALEWYHVHVYIHSIVFIYYE